MLASVGPDGPRTMPPRGGLTVAGCVYSPLRMCDPNFNPGHNSHCPVKLSTGMTPETYNHANEEPFGKH